MAKRPKRNAEREQRIEMEIVVDAHNSDARWTRFLNASLVLLVLYAFPVPTNADANPFGSGNAEDTAKDAVPEERNPAWAEAYREGPLDAQETRQFMKELTEFVFDNHLKKNPQSRQRGMIYEYLDTRRKGHPDQFVQGEGLDTMHDGAWFAAALVNAYRATGDAFYKQFLTEWTLPFYLTMLNHSDELFSSRDAVARQGAKPWGKPWAFQEGEKGFVPYFWDDGSSVSLERRFDSNPLGNRPCVDYLAGKPNPEFLLDGYSLGMSNHMAQDLGVMVMLSWLLLKDSDDPAEQKLAAETAEATRNLHECRVRHFGFIPMCVAPAALANRDEELIKRVPRADDPRYLIPNNAYTRLLSDFTPGERMHTPGFADDQQYHYYFGITKTGGQVPEPLAFKTIYDAYTAPLLYRYYSDDAEVPPGINRFDLHPIYFRDGKPEDYRSDRRGPFGGPKPIGSRMGPQNMVCCGWALQMLDAFPGIWEQCQTNEFPDDVPVYIDDRPKGFKPAKDMTTILKFSKAEVHLTPYRVALDLRGRFAGDSLTLTVYSEPDGCGSHATIRLDTEAAKQATKRDDAPTTSPFDAPPLKEDALPKPCSVIMVNDRGQALRGAPLDLDVVRPGKDANSFSAYPLYTVIKDQPPWLTVVEHDRFSIAVGDQVKNLYAASSRQQVKARLEFELGCGLRTWQAIFRHYGYIPTGIGTGSRWQGISDSGGYAHLISACAQWLIYLEGKRDWDLHRVPTL